MTMPTTQSHHCPLLVSMTASEVCLAGRGDDERLTAFASVVADRADGIELFVDSSHADMSFTSTTAEHAAELDLSIHTVHAPPIGLSESGLDGRWDVELNTLIKEILLAYEEPEPPQEVESSVLDTSSIFRRPKMDPSLVTTHLPRFPAVRSVDVHTARAKTIEAVGASIEYVTSDGFADGDWNPPIVSVENVSSRPGFDYLLTRPEDAVSLRNRHRKCGAQFELAFTCDVGHTPRPRAMLEAMQSPAAIHLHGVTDDSRAETAAALPDETDPSDLVTEPGDGTVQHLPPHEFSDRTLEAFEWLDETGRECPLVIELQRACKTPAVAEKLFDWFDDQR